MNKKVFLILILLAGPFAVQAQEDIVKKWYSTAEMDFVFPYKVRYGYGIENRGHRVNLEENLSFGALYSINYNLFKNLSVGAVGGAQAYFSPNFTMVKIGGVIRYFFVDPNNVYVYIQDAVNLSLDKSRFEYGNNFRIGLGFPIFKMESFNINTNLFFEQNYLSLEGSEALLFSTEDPGNIYFKSIGLSLGVKF